MTGRLFLLAVDNTVQEILPEEYGKLRYGAPEWEFMRKKLDVSMLEHVSVLWQGKPAHMFVDEMGHLDGKQTPNARATAIYANATFNREGRALYNELSAEPPTLASVYRAFGHYIVGPALLWTGRMT